MACAEVAGSEFAHRRDGCFADALLRFGEGTAEGAAVAEAAAGGEVRGSRHGAGYGGEFPVFSSEFGDRGWSISSRTGADSTILPAYMTQTRSAISETMPRLCVTRRIDMPVSFRRSARSSRICA